MTRGTGNRAGGVVGMSVMTVLAALLLAGGLVVRMSAPLASNAPSVRQRLIANGVLEMHSNTDTPLFDGVALNPGDPVRACARLLTDSPDDPAPILLSMKGYRGSDALAESARMTVEYGLNGSNADGCEAFRSEAVVATGSIAQLERDHGSAGSPMVTSDPRAGQSDVWFRVTVELPASAGPEVQGESIRDLGMRWSTSVAAPSDLGFAGQAALVLAAVSERSVIPLMLMLVLATLFLGVQDRIDRRDPKLALAPVVRGELTFEEPPGG